MTSYLESHRLPQFFVRGPDTTGPLSDISIIREFRDGLLRSSGVSQPTTLVINLEGRFPSVSVLVELIVPLAQSVKAGTHGPVTLIVCTQDEAVRTVVRGLAQLHDFSIYLAPSPRQLHEAEPAGPLTPTERESLAIVHRLGGRVTISTFANATGLKSNTATNRLVNVLNKGFVHRVERAGRHGQLFLDPRVARPIEDALDPTTGDFDVPESVRRDVRSLTEMQVVEPGEDLANAWNEFFSVPANREFLVSEHARLAKMVRDQDSEGLANAVAQSHSKKHSQARSNKGQN